MKVIAMIPARIGSQRLKYKNLALLNNKPLISYAIEKARKSGVFNEIYINSDHTIFKNIAKKYKIKFYLRNKNLGKSSITSDQVVFDFLKNNKCDYLVWVNPIAPLQEINDIKKSVKYLINHKINSLITVTNKKVHYLLKNKPINFDINKKFDKTQNLPAVSEMVYTLMMWNSKSFLKYYSKNKFAILHGKKFFYQISKVSSIIVKDKEDLNLIQNILSKKNKKIMYDKTINLK